MNDMTIVERLRMSAEKDLHEDWYKRECREAADHIQALEQVLSACISSLERADVTEGYCMCGDVEDAHGMWSGHSYTDAGSYHMQQAIDAARALLPICSSRGDAYADKAI